MIVIEYEMSITWNEHAIQVGRGSKDWFSYLGDKHRFFSRYSGYPVSLNKDLSSYMTVFLPSSLLFYLKTLSVLSFSYYNCSIN